jgi:hypothetical protein
MGEIALAAAASIWDLVDEADGLPVPDPITFVTGSKWLARPNLYPRQATLLKIIFLRTDLMTEFDHQVIAEWIAEFHATNPGAGEENKFSAHTNGIQPDIYERMQWCQERGYRWFKEVILAIGRRGSKGYTCALAMAYVLWNYMSTGNPQDWYGIMDDKEIQVLIFAGKKDQAKANLWGDLNNVITAAPCFTPYVSTPQAESLTVYAPHDFARMESLEARGIRSTKDLATFHVLPKESTLLSARGPTTAIMGFDEAAHVKNSGTSRSFGDVYGSATPSLDQFGKDAFIVIPSSTWEMTGLFYGLWENSLERETAPDGGRRGVYMNKLMLQLASWHPYVDWERAHELPLFPDGFEGDLGEYSDGSLPRLRELRGPIQAYDDEMMRLERSNPDTFAVERRSFWATSLAAYLNPGKVDAMFESWQERDPRLGPPEITVQQRGIMTVSYRAHGDPSDVNCRFGYSLCHLEPGPGGYQHVVFDQVKFWDPASYDDHFIDYDEVMTWIYEDSVRKFFPGVVTFDQYNVPATIRVLQKKVREGHLPKPVTVDKRDVSRELNWQTYETLKAAINLGFVHLPPHDEVREELKFLQKKDGQPVVVPPESGPCTTKDIADTIAVNVFELIGDQMVSFLAESLSAMRPAGAMHTSEIDPMSRFDPSASASNPYAHQLGGMALSRGSRPGPPGGSFRPGTQGGAGQARMPGRAAPSYRRGRS